MSAPHAPVLLQEILQAFSDCKLHTFVDGTLGAGGHAQAVLEAHPELVHFVGIDQDPQARAIAQERLTPWKQKIRLVPGNFKDLDRHLTHLGIEQVDGILLDLGVSSMQLDQPEKGFSFMREGPLDMRMDPSNPLTAEIIVNTWLEQDLARVFWDFGEEKQGRQAARAVVKARNLKPLKTTKDLANVLYPVLKGKAKKSIHPLTLVFQALRIVVNGELDALELVLPQAIRRLRSGGRLAVISFHSLEDRLVKNMFLYEASDKENTSGLAGLFLDKQPVVKLVTRKPLVATEAETEINPRSRSAKLRVAEKL